MKKIFYIVIINEIMIKILEEKFINEISAGEVITGPDAIVKELLENSIDSMAKEIDIEIQSGGKDLILVRDNGIGISRSEVKIAVQKHTTSKFKGLYNITTLGFRGEALFSIALASDMTIYSQKEEEEGYVYNCAKDSIHINPRERGTMVEIKNLFANLPVRKKFLKKDEYESKQIHNLIEEYAISYRDIRFCFKKNNRVIVYDYGDRFSKICEVEPENVIHFKEENNIYKLTGQFAPGETSDRYFLFLNNRPFKNKKILSTIRGLFKEITGKSNFPFCLFIECAPDIVDVNIHPQKQDVLFSDSSIFYFIRQCFQKAMEPQKISSNFQEKPINTEYLFEKKEKSTLPSEVNLNNNLLSKNTSINKSIDKEYLLKTKEELTSSSEINLNNNLLSKNTSIEIPQEKNKGVNVSEEMFRLKERISDLPPLIDDLITPMEKIQMEQKDCYPEDRENFGIYIGQVFSKYLLFQGKDKITFVDQHAAHERIIAENFEFCFHKQILLEPIVIPAKDHREKKLLKLTKILDFKKKDNNLNITHLNNFFHEEFILNLINTTDCSEKVIIQKYINEYGCKNAIKTGYVFNSEEANNLVKELLKNNNFMFCNHGRRTFFHLTLNKIDSFLNRS